MVMMVMMAIVMAMMTWMLHEEHLLAATQPLLGRNREKRMWRWHREDLSLKIFQVRISLE